MIRNQPPTDIVVHGAWTPPSLDIGREEIDQWHKERGFDQIGYHYVIRRDGTREIGRPFNVVGAHVAGQNAQSVGIVLVGGQDEGRLKMLDELEKNISPAGRIPEATKQDLVWEFNYTAAQMAELVILVADLLVDYDFRRIRGHRDYPDVVKRCPGFDVRAYFADTARLYGMEV